MFTRLKTLLSLLRYFWPENYPVDKFIARRSTFQDQIKQYNDSIEKENHNGPQ